jgi:drug/metabolite transporter (DMT)-like permease
MSPRPALRGVIAMLSAVALFSLMDAGLKLLTPHYPPMQVAALRGLASLPLVLAWAFATVGPRALLRVRWSLHLARGALAVLMMGCFAYALRSLPLSTAYALFFVAPLVITALSVPLLGEQVGPRRWSAIVVGLVGVLVVLRPDTEGMLTLGGLAVLVAALAYSVSAILVRVLGRSDSTQSMVVWMLAMLSLGAGAIAAPHWVALQAAHWPLIAGIGVTGALGQYAITEAFRRGEASLVAPLEYSALAWALVLDLLLWGVLPDAVTLSGAGIIVASGLYLIRRERVRKGLVRPPA